MVVDALPVVNAVLSAFNLATLIGVAFYGGRWMGRVETRLDHLERKGGTDVRAQV